MSGDYFLDLLVGTVAARIVGIGVPLKIAITLYAETPFKTARAAVRNFKTSGSDLRLDVVLQEGGTPVTETFKVGQLQGCWEIPSTKWCVIVDLPEKPADLKPQTLRKIAVRYLKTVLAASYKVGEEQIGLLFVYCDTKPTVK